MVPLNLVPVDLVAPNLAPLNPPPARLDRVRKQMTRSGNMSQGGVKKQPEVGSQETKVTKDRATPGNARQERGHVSPERRFRKQHVTSTDSAPGSSKIWEGQRLTGAPKAYFLLCRVRSSKPPSQSITFGFPFQLRLPRTKREASITLLEANRSHPSM